MVAFGTQTQFGVLLCKVKCTCVVPRISLGLERDFVGSVWQQQMTPKTMVVPSCLHTILPPVDAKQSFILHINPVPYFRFPFDYTMYQSLMTLAS